MWPDNCDGTYNSYCDASRNYTAIDITNILLDFSRGDLLDEMNTFWINQGAPNSDFWAHEFSKHATCTSTFDTNCYHNYVNGTEVIDFFETSLAYYKTRSTYDILAKGGVVPSNTTTYTLGQLQAAARNATGQTAYFGCSYANSNASSRTILSEVWYYGYTYGRVQDLRFVATDAGVFGNSSCAASGIRYPLRGNGTEINAPHRTERIDSVQRIKIDLHDP